MGALGPAGMSEPSEGKVDPYQELSSPSTAFQGTPASTSMFLEERAIIAGILLYNKAYQIPSEDRVSTLSLATGAGTWQLEGFGQGLCSSL